jgi:hypothetical protein
MRLSGCAAKRRILDTRRASGAGRVAARGLFAQAVIAGLRLLGVFDVAQIRPLGA